MVNCESLDRTGLRIHPHIWLTAPATIPDAASCFLDLIAEKLEAKPELVVPIMPELLPALRYVAENQAAFDADESIYGSFRSRLERIEALYTLRHDDKA